MAIDGTYIIDIQAPHGMVHGVLRIQAIGNGLCGSYEAHGIQPVGGMITENKFTFYTGVGHPPEQIKLEFNGEVFEKENGCEISGSASANGSDPSVFKGTRVNP
jgi:hypothetical protein